MTKTQLVKTATEMAAKAHAGQKYRVGNKILSYVEGHLQAVAFEMNLIMNACPHLKKHAGVLKAACWLHDTLEDTTLTKEEIKEACGLEVLNLVIAVTDVRCGSREQRKQATYPRIRAAGELAVAVKLADRIANVRSAEPGDRFFTMYRAEQTGFELGLRSPGELTPVWMALARCLDPAARAMQGQNGAK